MITDKQRLRKTYQQIRDSLSKQQRERDSQAICERLKQLKLVQEAAYICCYSPIRSEVDIMPFCDWLFAQGKQVAFPRVHGDTMDFYQIHAYEELQEGAFHVLEPVDDGRLPVDWQGALVLVPGLIFDKNGNRCGYGKGYYDKYFAGHPMDVGVGIAFEAQMSEELSDLCEATDYRLDGVVTEHGWHSWSEQMTRDELVSYLTEASLFGNVPGVQAARAAMEFLGNPQDQLRYVHIAGTNGKGSVAAYLREICVQAGVKCGFFTSPHLERFEERIQVGHEQIPEDALLRLGRRMLEAGRLTKVKYQIRLTMSDYCLGIALLYYLEQGVELVLLETGMGGRLDATNIIPAPVVSVITGIGLEHTRYLGDTIGQIAGEKAGILKKGTRAVLMDQTDEALSVFVQACAEKEIPYHISGIVGTNGDYKGQTYRVGIPGSYQRQNAAAAIEAAHLLREYGYKKIDTQAIQNGLEICRWPGRMERISDRPWVLLDGAHNVHGMTALVQALTDLHLDVFDSGEKFVFFIGIMQDKGYEDMIKLITPAAKQIYTLRSHKAGAMNAGELAAIARRCGVPSEPCELEQVGSLIADMSEDARVVICGSLYLIGEIRSMFEMGSEQLQKYINR